MDCIVFTPKGNDVLISRDTFDEIQREMSDNRSRQTGCMNSHTLLEIIGDAMEIDPVFARSLFRKLRRKYNKRRPFVMLKGERKK